MCFRPSVADEAISPLSARFLQSFTCPPGPLASADVSAWRASLQSEGYLFLRGLLPRSDVLRARQCVLTKLEARGLIHPPAAAPPSETEVCLPALAVDSSVSPNILGDLELQSQPAIVGVLEHPRIVSLLQEMWTASPGETTSVAESPSPPHVWTSQYKWLRAVSKGRCTGFHLDRVYMAGTTPLYSLWLPFGDLSPAHGNLVLSPRSHASAQFHLLREGYGESGAGRKGDGTTSGWVKVDEWTKGPVEVSQVEAARAVVQLQTRHPASASLPCCC